MSLTFFDFAMFGLIGFFILLGFIRGFVREIFSIITWVLASVTTVLLSPILNSIILKKISIPILANIISNSFVFTLFLIGISILATNLARNLSGKIPLSINLSLGTAFGFAKGFLFASLIFSGIFILYDGKDYSDRVGPDWFAESQSYKPLSFGAYIVHPFSQILFSTFGNEDVKDAKPPEDLIENDKKQKRDILDEIIDDEVLNEDDTESLKKVQRFRRLGKKLEESNSNLSEEKEELDDEQGYNKEQINKMDRLIDTL